MAVENVAYTPGGKPIPIVDANETGFNSLNAESFLKLLVTQLQNQDPTAPTSNEELLGQISGIRDLQSNLELSETLKTLTTSQSTSSQTQQAASYLGKLITAELDDGRTISGTATAALIEDGKAYVKIGDEKIPVENVISVTLPEAAAA